MKEDAIRELKLLEVRRVAADSLRLRRRELEVDTMLPPGLACGSGAVMGGGSRREEWLSDAIDRCDAMHRREVVLRDLVAQTERALAALSPRHRTVLEALYVHPRNSAINWLQAELYLSRTQVYRVRDDALTRFGLLMGYGI